MTTGAFCVKMPHPILTGFAPLKDAMKMLDGWRDIKTAPREEGLRFLAMDKDGFKFITEYRPDDVIGDGCYGVVDSCCGYYEDMKPVKWKPL